MTKSIIVVGHKKPDNDSIVGAVIYSDLKNKLEARAAKAEGREVAITYVPCCLGPLPPESEWVLAENGFATPRLIATANEVEPADPKVVLVDHNELTQCVDGLADAEVVEIVDHHRIADVSTANPIQFINLPWGSTATIIAAMYKYYDVEVTREIATALLSAVLTDTVILSSPTTTEVDCTTAADLAKLADVDIKEFGMGLFLKREGDGPVPIERLVAGDAKEFKVRDNTVLIGQFETVDLSRVTSREEEIRAYMSKLVQEKGYEFVLFFATDIVAKGSQFFVEGNDAIVNEVFGITCCQGGNWMPGVMSRKKQVAAPILAY